MNREQLRDNWTKLTSEFSLKFADGADIDLDGILFIIGIQELSNGQRRFKKDEKLQVMHVAICTLLEPYGYYEFLGVDEDKWPHFKVVQNLPNLKAGEQSYLIKEAIVQYALHKEWL